MKIANLFRKNKAGETVSPENSVNGYRSVLKILSEDDDLESKTTFLHNIPDLDTAKRILNEGFEFMSDMANTADNINKADEVSLAYWESMRKPYGDYTLIIQIGNDVYTTLLNDNELILRQLKPEHILSKDRRYDEDESDYVYRLNEKFVKGYIDRKKGEFYRNPNFDPSYFDESMKDKDWNIASEIAAHNSMNFKL